MVGRCCVCRGVAFQRVQQGGQEHGTQCPDRQGNLYFHQGGMIGNPFPEGGGNKPWQEESQSFFHPYTDQGQGGGPPLGGCLGSPLGVEQQSGGQKGHSQGDEGPIGPGIALVPAEVKGMGGLMGVGCGVKKDKKL